ncbi:peptidoglycan-binding protein [Plectonema cf. radiosum LEGE 06105]|uniref:Peptidoglycan-binding protein n=1 Tax=Plectonema cf. radiosum LEGE 06105 TaxID=945769 RepID=A0A8J7F943_9CYAN|nr:peptidoglycan-binding protein [Plectonema radiosum]MBE9214449.1 peptidoglycan-binding protein [Plectonema cf. radiosum LEGE 06105]
MRRCYYPIVIFTYLSCLGIDINSTGATNYKNKPFLLEIAQVNSSDTILPSNLRVGSAGENVKVLQNQLKKLGYYDGITDGQFGTTTRNAVIKFQQDKGLFADGIAGSRTRQLLQTEIAKQSGFTSTPTPEAVSEPNDEEEVKFLQSDLIRFGLIAVGILAGVGILFYVIQWFRYSRQLNNADTYVDDDTEIAQPFPDKLENGDREEYIEDTDLVQPSLPKLQGTQEYLPSDAFDGELSTVTPSSDLLPAEKTSRLIKVNVVDELIKDLESSNPTKRRKAIWELGQKGDSRAIQPLVEQMVESDSQQRSLILAALAEIGTRTLKPMNRALAVSLQDESPDVRKNAIRDLTRVYDMMAQISQMLSMAMEDEDSEVQETARYAISQMNRIRILPSEGPQTQIQYPQEWQDDS